MIFVEKVTEARTEMQRLLDEKDSASPNQFAKYTQKKEDTIGTSEILGQRSPLRRRPSRDKTRSRQS
jgi:hypothetical protein